MMATVDDGERVVRFVGTLPDGTYIVEHPDGRLERKADQTAWARVDAMTDEDIDRAIVEDPDSDPANFDWSKAEVVYPPKKQAVSIRWMRMFSTISARRGRAIRPG